MNGRPRDLVAIIPGPSQPQGSTRSFVSPKTGKVITTSANKRLKAWREEAVLVLKGEWAKTRRQKPWEGPVRVWIEDSRKRPRSGKRKWPAVRPDLDKIVRACLDVLVLAGVIVDDGQVCEIEAYKCYRSEPRVEIRVYPIWDTWEENGE